MKFFYGFLVLALFAAAQAAPSEAEQAAVASPAVAPVAETKDDKKDADAVSVEVKKEENQALATINNALESIVNSGLLGDAVNFSQKDNVDLLIGCLKDMDPILRFLEKVRNDHPIFAPAITQYHALRNALESHLRIFLAPFNLIIGAASMVFRIFG